ncbi:uncharacterized protein LOC126680131 [Mercurialis annua]|uniref:uncharacterized protein LOC126680131 n=1 Tax=Mercurialis annua TaxID=3986 RepID=UPI00215FA66E|nr:uncharacterized protein LOC126680131 [Mercurialis annua]
MAASAKFQALPPLKRLRLLQQQNELENNKENEPITSFQLPAKKRKQSRHSLSPEKSLAAASVGGRPTTYSLPAKKRIWAFNPDFISDSNPFSPIDLNLEYKPSSDDIEIKPIQTADQNLQPTDDEEEEEADDGILCAVCQSTDGDPTDPIVFCDGCDLMVHTTCYGNPLINGVPDGDWFCTHCLASQSDNNNNENQIQISCCLCTTKGGALKPTKNGQWAHIVCAVLVPEVFFEDPVGREGIDCSKIPKRRWDGKCCVCKSRKGCVIECSEENCGLAFHVSCGVSEDFCIEYKECRRKDEAIVAGFCRDHTVLWKKQQKTGKFKIVAKDEHKRK